MKLLRWLLVACPVLIILSFLSLVLLRSSSDVSETPVVDKLRSVEHFPMDCSSGEDLSSRTSSELRALPLPTWIRSVH